MTRHVPAHARASLHTSVPTTRPPSGWRWRSWDDPTSSPPWTWERVVVWRPGWRSTRVVVPKLRPAGSPVGLMWRPDGERLTPAEVALRLARQVRG